MIKIIKKAIIKVAYSIAFVVGMICSIFSANAVEIDSRIEDYSFTLRVDDNAHTDITCGLIKYNEDNSEIVVVWNDMSITMRGTDDAYLYTKEELVKMVYANVDDNHKKAMFKLLTNGNLLTKKLCAEELRMLAKL